MIIRATNKLLKISGIKPVILNNNNNGIFPGEWYANIVKTGQVGKLVVLLFHNTTKISIICPTKSLNIAIKQLPIRVENYLTRHGFEKLIPKLDLNSEIQIYTTNSKSTLAYMNPLSFNIEWHLSKTESLKSFDYNDLEDILSKYLFTDGGKSGKYETTLIILERISIT